MRTSLVAGVLALALGGCAPPAASATGGIGSLAPQWHWTDEEGADVTFSRWQGVPLVVTAIFTSCTTRCPMTVDKLRDLDAAFRRRGAPSQFLLVTLDPQTDDPARLARFKAERHLPDAWHFLRGDLDQTRRFARMLGVRAMYDDQHIDHDVRIAVFDGHGRLVRDLAGWDFDSDKVAALP